MTAYVKCVGGNLLHLGHPTTPVVIEALQCREVACGQYRELPWRTYAKETTEDILVSIYCRLLMPRKLNPLTNPLYSLH